MPLRLLHLLLLFALGLMLSGAPRLCVDMACADASAEEGLRSAGVEEREVHAPSGCPDEEGAADREGSGPCSGGLACCMCTCRTPPVSLPASAPPHVPSRAEGLALAMPQLLALTSQADAGDVFLPPRLG